jgi:hypothetical protein
VDRPRNTSRLTSKKRKEGAKRPLRPFRSDCCKLRWLYVVSTSGAVERDEYGQIDKRPRARILPAGDARASSDATVEKTLLRGVTILNTTVPKVES